MRITGGEWARRVIRVPGERVRPTQDKVRQALFSSLGVRVVGCHFLDLFAGSGAVGLEALSRGAARVCWVESDGRVLRVLRENVKSLCGESGAGEAPTRIVRADVFRFPKGADAGTFDIIFADPPYDLTGEMDWLRNTLKAVEAGHILARGGVLIMEQAARTPLAAWPAWRVVGDKTYGETRLLTLAHDNDETGMRA